MPAYIPDYQNDVFVSYGYVDDQSEEGDKGWVSSFLDDLKKRLSERLGRKDCFLIWRDDDQLARHVDIPKQISSAIAGSSCMLVILSPGYLKSDWCKRERNDFLKWVHDRDEEGSRIFIVERDWIKDDKPPEFQNLLGFKFWTGTPLSQNDLPRPLDKTRQSDLDEYKDQLNRLALALESELGRLKSLQISRRPGSGPVVVRANTATVFLAEVTDDLRPQWKKVRSELDQQGVRVVSGGAPRDVAALEKAVAQALAESQVFVQLLSQFPGQPLPDSSETYALLQHRLAAVSKNQILQWRSPQLTERLFDQEVEDLELAAQHRRLVFGRVRAEHIEDFKRYLIEVATAPPRPELLQLGSGTVFISFNPNDNDSEIAERLCGCLSKRGFGVITPLNAEDAEPEVIRADFEKNVLSSRAWIVVYGEPKQKYWIRGQLNEINQLLCQNKKRGARIHLCAGPPKPKNVSNPFDMIGMALPQMAVIDCQEGIENLDDFGMESEDYERKPR
jgi:hypothetical protein